MVPLSEINDVRRRAIKQLEDEWSAMSKIKTILTNYHEFNIHETENLRNFDFEPYHAEDINLIVHVDSLDMLKTAIEAGANSILFGGESYHHEALTPRTYQEATSLTHRAGKQLYIATPRIVRDADQPDLEEILSAVKEADAVYVHNVATLGLVRRLTNLPIHTDYSLIVFNSEIIKYLKYINVKGVTLSPELTFEQVKSLTKDSPLPVECIVHGRSELMISSYCVAGSFLGGVGEHKCSQPCKRQRFYLRDRKAAIFPIVTDQFCRMHILNSKPLSMLSYVADFKKAGISAIRIDARAMSSKELDITIKNYRRALFGDSIAEDNDFDFTRGHYFRGILLKD